MSYPNDAPAAAWYPDPQTPGQVRWWDGTNWTEHVSKPAAPQTAQASTASEPAEQTPVAPTAAAQAPAAQTPVVQTIAEQLAAAPATPVVAEADAAFAAADEPLATVTYIGRHAAGATPAPRRPATAPRFRSRERVAHVELPVDVQVETRVEAYQYA